MLVLKCLLVLLVQIGLIFSEPVRLELLMPNVAPKTKDTYLCHKFKLNEDQPVYINQLEANSSQEIAHHILLFSCDDPVEEDTWNCGEMSHSIEESEYKSGPVCNQRQSIIFAWALDAPKLILPKNVGFKLGGKKNSYLVMQVHYANVDKFLEGETDNSGLVLKGQTEPLPNLAGVYLFSTGGTIKAHTDDRFEAACEMTENVVLHPFAYRTHAHKLGVVTSGYLVHTNPKTGSQTWTEIGRRSPQLPQMFFPVSNEVEVHKGDILTVSCSMHNFRDRDTSIGPTGDDEMCNLYIMYYVNGDHLLQNNLCFGMGPPYAYLKDFVSPTGKKLDMSRLPEDSRVVPSVQKEELERMKSSGRMAHGMSHDEPKQQNHNEHQQKADEMSHMNHQIKQEIEEESEENNDVLDGNNQNLIKELVKNYEKELSGDNFGVSDKSDEYEEYLGELEKAYLVNKFLKKLELQSKRR